MAKTRTQAIAAVLEDLDVLDRSGNVNTADSAKVQTRFDAGVELLERNDVIVIADPVNAIPDDAFLPLVAWLVEECRRTFHQTRDDAAMARAEAMLRRIARRTYTVGDTVAEKLAARIMRGLQRIGADEAPSATEVALIGDKMVDAIADLEHRSVISLGDVEDVADLGAFDAFADYMIGLLMPEFGQEGMAGRLGPLSTIKRDNAERRLRKIGADQPTYQPLVAAYF
jgi:hypothetical protein